MPGLVRELARERLKYRNAPARALPGLVARYLRLHASSPGNSPVPARAERVVISLSTIPSRLGAIRPVLRSLLDQVEPADAVWLALPAVSAREGRAYPAMAPMPGVEVLAVEDRGPATKLLGALERAAPTDLVIAVDDDVVYPPDFVRTLLRAHRAHPDAALGYRGWRVEPGVAPRNYRHWLGTAATTPIPVDILLGTWGLAVQPRFFDAAARAVPDGLTVDDVWFAGCLRAHGVERLVVPAALPPIETWTSRVRALTDGPNRSGEADSRWIQHFWGEDLGAGVEG